MKLTIDLDACYCSGECYYNHPSLFKMRDDGFPEIIVAEPATDQEKLEAEQKKFDNGMSTSFEVLTFQRDLANAELRLTNAQLDYIKALAAFERSKGTLLEARGLEIADR